MKTTPIQLDTHILVDPHATPESIKTFYDEATQDYSFWSKDVNMHFGHCTVGRTHPFLRDTTLNEMNRQVLLRLNLSNNRQITADLGCGMGGTMRNLMKRKPNLYTLGITLSDFQVQEANKVLSHTKGCEKIL